METQEEPTQLGSGPATLVRTGSPPCVQSELTFVLFLTSLSIITVDKRVAGNIPELGPVS